MKSIHLQQFNPPTPEDKSSGYVFKGGKPPWLPASERLLLRARGIYARADGDTYLHPISTRR